MRILAGGLVGVPEQATSQDGDLLGQLVEAVGLGGSDSIRQFTV